MMSLAEVNILVIHNKMENPENLLLKHSAGNVIMDAERTAMMTKDTSPIRSLEERLRLRAEKTAPDKVPAAICKVIEVRRVLTEQRLRGHSWASLTQMLADEGLNLTAGTLRNYLAQIGHAEDILCASGNADPSDAQIHGALRQSQARRPAASCLQPAKNITPHARASRSKANHDPHEDL